jgi:hypothetical protein
MIRTKLFVACALAFVVSLVATTASAQEPTNQITYFTFSAPFELPGGKTLPAGKYVFKILDSPSNRHVVQIMSEDQTQMHATVLAIPAQRQQPSDEPEVRFMEAEANAAPAVRTWWYPGRTIGHEFIYPKDQARRLAARQSEGVLTTAGDTTGDDAMKTADLTRLGANGQETAAESTTAENTPNQTAAQSSAAQTGSQSAQTTSTTAANSSTQSAPGESTTPTQSATSTGQAASSAPAATRQSSSSAAQSTTAAPTTAETATAQSRAATTAGTAAATSSARTELPRTASSLPLVGLLGLVSLLGAGVLRFGR